MNKRLNFAIGSTVLLLLLVTVGLTQAQGLKPGEASSLGGESTAAAAPGAIPVQGRLTDASGTPLNGTQSLTFSIYDVETGGTALCTDTNSVDVQDGLFNSYIDGCSGDIWGQELWFAVKVGSDPEMTPRQVIYPVPYALSLRPGALISGTGYPILEVISTNPSGRALRAYALATSGANYGVVGASMSPNGYGGYFYNEESGIGVYGKGTPGVLGETSGVGHGIVGRAGLLGAGVKGEGNPLGFGGFFTNTTNGIALVAESDGIALKLQGSGRIESTADSYVFVPAMMGAIHGASENVTARVWGQGVLQLDSTGDTGDKEVVFPVTLPGVLYGQSVQVEEVSFAFKVTGDLTAIQRVRIYRTESNGDERIILDNNNGGAGWTSLAWLQVPLPISADRVLDADDGLLTVRVTCFIPAGSQVQFTGIRVRLGHN